MDPVASAGSHVDGRAPSNTDTPKTIAHRGFAGVYPENTHTAMRRATADRGGEPDRTGVDAVEIDVVPCATGELLVFHDASPGRVTNATGAAADRPIWERSFENVRELEVLDTGETIPTLAELLETIPNTVEVVVELKNPGTTPARSYRDLPRFRRAEYDRAWDAVVERLLAVLDRFDHDNLVVSSFEGAINALVDRAPDLRTGYFCWDSVETGLSITRRYDCAVFCPPRTMVPGTPFFNEAYSDLPAGGFEERDVVSIANAEGRAVYAWTIETGEQAASLRAQGVDGLLCEYPGLLGEGNRPAFPVAGTPDPEPTTD